MAITSTDPRTGETRATFEPLDDGSIERKLQQAEKAFASWRRTSFEARARPLLRAAELLDSEKDSFGRMMTEEMGKTHASAIAEAEKCAWVCRYYAEHAPAALSDVPVATNASSSYVRHLPLGPILAVMPWNFPFWQVFRFLAPSIMAGNVGLLKHASNVPKCAIAIEELLLRAGLPEGVFQTLLIGSASVPRVLGDRRVVATTLTGSTGAGSAVASLAGKLIKPSVLELGGSDPFIVMPSADREAALRAGVSARILNNGQSCINAKRFIVHRDVYDDFEAGMVAAFDALRVGDPMDRETEVGPLALDAVRKDVIALVEDSVRAGARCLTGGASVEGAGFWFRPGVLSAIPKAARVYREEVFGPVALLFRADDIDHAIALANESPFGLGSSVWTEDEREQRRFIEEIEAGQTFVNAMVASDPRLPFGGIKESGFGRELGDLGIRAFVNLKTVFIASQPRGAQSATE